MDPITLLIGAAIGVVGKWQYDRYQQKKASNSTSNTQATSNTQSSNSGNSTASSQPTTN